MASGGRIHCDCAGEECWNEHEDITAIPKLKVLEQHMLPRYSRQRHVRTCSRVLWCGGVQHSNGLRLELAQRH